MSPEAYNFVKKLASSDKLKDDIDFGATCKYLKIEGQIMCSSTILKKK